MSWIIVDNICIPVLSYLLFVNTHVFLKLLLTRIHLFTSNPTHTIPEVPIHR